MARVNRVTIEPRTGQPELDQWIRQVTDALNLIPLTSITSTSDGPESNVTADPGTFLIDTGSSNTTFWVKTSGDTTTGWLAVDLV